MLRVYNENTEIGRKGLIGCSTRPVENTETELSIIKCLHRNLIEPVYGIIISGNKEKKEKEKRKKEKKKKTKCRIK